MAMETHTYMEEENRLANALAEQRMQNMQEEERAPSPLQPEECVIDPNIEHHIMLDELANQRIYRPDQPDPPLDQEQSRVWSYLAR